jgi:hypothetical protein
MTEYERGHKTASKPVRQMSTREIEDKIRQLEQELERRARQRYSQ